MIVVSIQNDCTIVEEPIHYLISDFEYRGEGEGGYIASDQGFIVIWVWHTLSVPGSDIQNVINYKNTIVVSNCYCYVHGQHIVVPISPALPWKHVHY